MKFAKIVFWAAASGVCLILTPLFFISFIGRNDPSRPLILAFIWLRDRWPGIQLAFIVIALTTPCLPAQQESCSEVIRSMGNVKKYSANPPNTLALLGADFAGGSEDHHGRCGYVALTLSLHILVNEIGG